MMRSLRQKLEGGRRQNMGVPQAISLDRYPEDVLLYMANHLLPSSLLNLRLVCRHLGAIFAHLALRDVNITFHQYYSRDNKRTNKRYELYSSTLPNLYQYAHTLRIRLENDIPLKLLPPLYRTLGRFHSLKSLRLIWESGEDVDQYIKDVVGAILSATNGKLERLVLLPPEGVKTFPEALQEIRGLTSLTIERDRFGWNCSPPSMLCDCLPLPMGTSIAPLLIANPQIEELIVVHGCQKNQISPNDIFSPTFPKFKTLIVNGLGFPPSRSGIHIADTPALLRNLCHLQILAPYNQSNLDPLWILLKAAHTHLESLVTKQVSPILADYLASFPGLHSLQIRNVESGKANSSTDVANTFLTNVLPRHAPTLKRLVIGLARDVSFLPGWSFEADRWASSCLPSLTNLRFIAFHPPLLNESGNSARTDDATAVISSYQLVIDHIQDLPILEEVTFLQTSRFIIGSMYIEWKDRSIKVLREAIPNLRGTTGRPYRLYSFYGASSVTRKNTVGSTPVFGWTTPILQPDPYVGNGTFRGMTMGGYVQGEW
ncbi:hypothetical protein BDN72DRAFT_838606 [Pluteus cervinus]|uniref:Uncharacterized protein n=1 Tax=Pluteus cervinus TaxID=181527 RepID=A0ACD3AZC7_9AGAR|nr:hypothetical protein BDN72DRAFT_838606 [Pluteus cervinus]